MQGRLGPGAGSLEGDPEEARVRLLDALDLRVEDVVEEAREAEPVEHLRHRPVRVRDDDELQAARAQALEAGDDLRGHVLPQVVIAVIGAELDDGRVDGGGAREAGLLEQQVEVEPAALGVARHLRRLGRVEGALREEVRLRERIGGHGHAVTLQRLADPYPVGVDEHPAGVEEERLERAHETDTSSPRVLSEKSTSRARSFSNRARSSERTASASRTSGEAKRA